MTTSLELLHVANLAAAAGAEQLLAWREDFSAKSKGVRDFVTDADLASEKAIRAVIQHHFPDHGILGEESVDFSQLERPYCWIVDPLDGTTNYLHQFPCYAVSVAVAQGNELLAGVVLDPLAKETFAAARGGGATLNGIEISTSEVEKVDESLVAISFPPVLEPDSPDLQAFLRVATRCQAVRRTGSAALNLAYVASGRLDAHWAHQIHPWDAAAGVLLIEEAGGVVTASDGSTFDLVKADYFTAATKPLHKALSPLVH